MLQRLRERAEPAGPARQALTEQERHILELIGEGLTNRQIGERMFLAEKTVKNYVSNLFAKLGMRRRTQAAASPPSSRRTPPSPGASGSSPPPPGARTGTRPGGPFAGTKVPAGSSPE